ncbi:D-amino acid dehydrogenase 3 [Nymphon striatum]|nr:D-amino acid dehydrogenase 3 [Nymphon striatum]
MQNIAIIGAGITGTTTAWALIKRGYNVTIFDRNRYAGMETSFANGGQLSASNAEAKDAGVDFDLEKRGILHIYENKKSFDHATKVNALLAKGGLERHAVSATEVKEIEPTLNGDFYGGYYTQSDSTGDIHKFCSGLEAACNAVMIDFERNGKTENANFDAVVISAGVGSRNLATQLGDRVNVYPVKGYSITVNLPDAQSQSAAPWTSILDDEAKLVTSRLGKDRFRVAGTAEFSGYNKDIRDDRIRPLTKWCEHLFPDMSTEQVVPWAGLRPMMPNMMPRVGNGNKTRIYYNTGHGHLGWTLSAATADIIAAKIEADMVNSNHQVATTTTKLSIAAE